MNAYFRLSYLTDQDKTVSVRIPNAKTTATGVIVNAAMQKIMNNGIAVSKQGTFVKKLKAQRFGVTKTAFNV